jgi:thiamine biosynthesis protein ThiS
MILTINGQKRTFAAPITVGALVSDLGLEARKVAVERNREIVPKSGYDATCLEDGDILEIVHFVGGG